MGSDSVSMVLTQPVVNDMDPAVSTTTSLPYHVPGHNASHSGPGTNSSSSLSPDIEHASSSIQTDNKRSYLDKDVSNSNLKQEPIAIVGMAVNMPGATNVDQLWEILTNGSNTVEEVSFL